MRTKITKEKLREQMLDAIEAGDEIKFQELYTRSFRYMKKKERSELYVAFIKQNLA